MGRRFVRSLVATMLLAPILVLASAAPASASHTISSYSPPSVTLAGDVALTVRGTGFEQDFIVQLVQLDDLGLNVTKTITGVTESSDSKRIVSGIPTRGEDPGEYFVQVVDPGDDGVLGGDDDEITRTSGVFTIQSLSPSISTLTPATGKQGTTVDIVVTGANFTKNGVFSFIEPGPDPVNQNPPVTITEKTWVSLDQVNLKLTIAAATQVGKHDIKFDNGPDDVTLLDAFEVTTKDATPTPPMISDAYFDDDDSTNTSSNATSRTSVPITIILTNGNSTISQVNVTLVGAGGNAGFEQPVTIDTISSQPGPGVPPPTVYTYEGTVDLAGVAPGPYSVRVQQTTSNVGTGTHANDLSVFGNGRPDIDTPTKASPANIQYNKGTLVNITGSNFYEGVTFTTNDPAVTIGNVDVISATSVRVTVTTTTDSKNGTFHLVGENTDEQTTPPNDCDDCLRQSDAPLNKWKWFARLTLNSGPAQIQFTLGDSRETPLLCDWDGDGIDTVATFNTETRVWTIYKQNSSASPVLATFAYGRPGDLPICGDWNGDGTATVGAYRGNVFLLRNSNTPGAADATIGYGRGREQGDVPVVGDYDGNGSETLGVRRGNQYLLRNANTTGVEDLRYHYGKDTDEPLFGDYDGNTTDTPGIRRGPNVYLRNSNDSGVADFSFNYGLETDISFIGDFNGNNFDDIAIVRKV